MARLQRGTTELDLWYYLVSTKPFSLCVYHSHIAERRGRSGEAEAVPAGDRWRCESGDCCRLGHQRERHGLPGLPPSATPANHEGCDQRSGRLCRARRWRSLCVRVRDASPVPHCLHVRTAYAESLDHGSADSGCRDETLRLFPVVPTNGSRGVPSGSSGVEILGQCVFISEAQCSAPTRKLATSHLEQRSSSRRTRFNATNATSHLTPSSSIPSDGCQQRTLRT